ncbi:NlpC/P60 family protein [Streptomyces sp. 7N604]|uniref:NlpC/P60 family protein n=1 Tax=Streptomyces sp. 7N604 TaxID=3457415 RepID=UPI003FD008FB
MASHRKPRQRSLTGTLTGTFTGITGITGMRGGTAARTAATLALASAAGATGVVGAAQAEPSLTPAQVKAKVDRLHHEAEVATEKYNGAREKTSRAQKELDRLRDKAARRSGRLNASRNALGSIATAQYRSGGIDPAVQLALSSSPDDYLERAAAVERAGSRQAAAVSGIQRQLRDIEQVRAEAGEKVAELRCSQAALKRHKHTVQEKLREAEGLLDRLTAEQRAQLLGRDGHGADAAASARAGRGASRGPVRAPNVRAATAVSYAFGALGKPYVWGATGPNGYDCSGLTQAAWKAAGVSLPRTTFTQINAGQRISRSQLAPGDLVFFYSGVSHVGLYIGDGQMIHAPRPGAPVRVAAIDEMPFAGATRPA